MYASVNVVSTSKLATESFVRPDRHDCRIGRIVAGQPPVISRPLLATDLLLGLRQLQSLALHFLDQFDLSGR